FSVHQPRTSSSCSAARRGGYPKSPECAGFRLELRAERRGRNYLSAVPGPSLRPRPLFLPEGFESCGPVLRLTPMVARCSARAISNRCSRSISARFSANCRLIALNCCPSCPTSSFRLANSTRALDRLHPPDDLLSSLPRPFAQHEQDRQRDEAN